VTELLTKHLTWLIRELSVTAEEFNRLRNDEDTIVVDMRNHYEYEVGRFEKGLKYQVIPFRAKQLPMADMLKDKKGKEHNHVSGNWRHTSEKKSALCYQTALKINNR
jgi:rhodanese-related sulfurtransferase